MAVQITDRASKGGRVSILDLENNDKALKAGVDAAAVKTDVDTALAGKSDNGHTHTVATTSTAGLMSSTDKAKLDGVAAGANNYAHPTGDGSQHVPATGTTSNGKVLKAGATAGSAAWGVLTASDVGAASLGANAFTGVQTLVGIRETKITIAANAIDLALGNFFSKSISGATTFTVSNVPASGLAGSFILDLTNGGSAAITWFSGVKWAGGTAPTLTASGRDVLGFFTHDAGATWTGFVLGKDVK